MNKEQPEDSPKMVVADCVEIFIRNGIVHVVYDDEAEIGMEVKREMHLAFLKITNGFKMPFLFLNKGTVWISKDAREYDRKIEAHQPFLATACVAGTLGVRLMAEFYGKFYKPEVPYKVFTDEKTAIAWLKEFS